MGVMRPRRHYAWRATTKQWVTRVRIQIRKGRLKSGGCLHREMSNTPNETSSAPAQRRQQTCSLRKILAKRVLDTFPSAVAGTAKLSSATANSATKEKKETACARIPVSMQKSRDSPAITRATAPGRKS